MKHLAVIAASVLSGFHIPVSASSEIAFVDHLVVVTPDEAIHFSDGGNFYVVKELLESSITENKSQKSESVEDQAIPVYLIGDGKLRTLEVGADGVRWDGTVYSMSEKAFSRFLGIVVSREGEGTSLDRLEAHLDFLVTRSR